MATTPNLGLYKPTLANKPVITDLDQNWDKIDTAINDALTGETVVAPTIAQAASNFPYLVNLATDPRYMADRNGVVESVTALQNAVNDATASGSKCIDIYIPAGTYKWEKSGVKGVYWNGLQTGSLRIHGDDKSTVIKRAGTTTASFIIAQGGTNYNNLRIDHLLFDWQSQHGVQWGTTGIILSLVSGGVAFSADNIWITDVETRNIYKSGSGGPWHQDVCIEHDSVSVPCTVTNIHVENFVFGRVGGGSFYGICIQHLNPILPAGAIDKSVAMGQVWNDNSVYYNNIFVKNGYHSCGATSVAAPQSNIIIGSNGHGDKLVIEDFEGVNSGDDGCEINSMHDVTMRRVYCHGMPNAAIYFDNLGGMPDPWNQYLRVEDCTFDCTTGKGMETTQSAGRGPIGHVVIKNSRAYRFLGSIEGNFQSLTLDGNRVYSRTARGSSFNAPAFFSVNQLAGRAKITIRDEHYDFFETQSGSTNAPALLNLAVLNDAYLDINGVATRLNLTGAAAFRPSVIQFNNDGRGAHSETFPTLGYVLAWLQDNGALSDLLPVSNKLTSVANPGTEARWIGIWPGSDYYYGTMGPLTDGTFSWQTTPGATITDYKHAVLYWISPTNYIDAYITDDGTHSFLCLDKVVAGVRTSLVSGGSAITTPTSYQASTGLQLASRIATGTAMSVRLKVVNNTVTADYWATATRTTPTTTGSTATVTTTLTGSDITLFGAGGQGYGGFGWVPVGADATGANWFWDRMQVYGGTIANLSVMSASNVQQFLPILFNETSSFMRFHGGKLSFRDCDFSRGSVGGTVADFSFKTTDLALAKQIDRRGIRYAGTFTQTTPSTPTSGTAYVPTDIYPMLISWTGGALSGNFVETSTDLGVTWVQQWFGNQPGSLIVSPNDQIRWTYTSAPTITKLPLGEQPTTPLVGSMLGRITAASTSPASRTTAVSTTLTNTDEVLFVTATGQTVTLQSAVTATVKRYTIKNTSSGTVTLATTSSQTIDGAAPGTMSANQSLEIFPDGANWQVL